MVLAFTFIILFFYNPFRPPLNGTWEFPSQGLSNDGAFSAKSAYEFLSKNHTTTMHTNPLFDLVWTWHDPQRIRAHLWKLCHARLLTNYERRRRNMTNGVSCIHDQKCSAKFFSFGL